MIRKAVLSDLDAIADIYDEIHTEEEEGRSVIGWIRDVYPVRSTAAASLERGDMFVLEEDGHLAGCAIINQLQVDAYAGGSWIYDASQEDVMVLHTLVISPRFARRGYGRAFVAFYEDYARSHGCHTLRMDTNQRNLAARTMYKHLGYREAGIVPTVFNGIPNVGLVLLEKQLG